MTLVRAIHWAGRYLLRAEGFRWELRRRGELKIGLWRKVLRSGGGKPRPRRQVEPYPRRLIWMPGFGDTSLSWLFVITPLLPILRLKYDELVLLDFPGYCGFLSSERGFSSMDMLMNTLFDVLDELRPSAIVAHSLGGCLTAHYAGSERKGYPGPELILLMNPSGLLADDKERREWESKLRALADGGFGSWRRFLFVKEPFWFGLAEREFTRFITSEEAQNFLKSVRDDHLVTQALPKIRARTWLVWGEGDALLPSSGAVAWLAGLASLGDRANAVLIRGAGHTIQIESPVAAAAVIAQILTGHEPHALGARWWRRLDAPRASISRT